MCKHNDFTYISVYGFIYGHPFNSNIQKPKPQMHKKATPTYALSEYVSENTYLTSKYKGMVLTLQVLGGLHSR